MGVTPIEYRPWEGKRTEYYRRFLVILKTVLLQKLKSKWILALLIIGVILAHVFPIIFSTIIPHEKLTPEMMVGEEPRTQDVQEQTPIAINGSFESYGSVILNGYIHIEGSIFGYGTIEGKGTPLSNAMISDNGFVQIIGTIILDGILELSGGITGRGVLNGNCIISGSSDIQTGSPFAVNGTLELNGSVSLGGHIDIDGDVSGIGTIIGNGTPISNTTISDNGTLMINGTVTVDGAMDMSGIIIGTGHFNGNGAIFGVGESSDDPSEEGPAIRERQGGYLKSGLLVIFTILLASLVCADLIADDLGDNSFILYFSRSIKSRDYLGGKMLGALCVLGIFCFIPPTIFCLAVMGTQSGSDYGTSLNVLGSTFIAGLLTTFIFLPYGLFISSMTKRKSYATIGIFMSFFVLIIIGNIFLNFDRNWVLLDPTRVLYYSYDILYGYSLPEGINGSLLGVVLFIILVIPLIFVYLRIHLKAVGK